MSDSEIQMIEWALNYDDGRCPKHLTMPATLAPPMIGDQYLETETDGDYYAFYRVSNRIFIAKGDDIDDELTTFSWKIELEPIEP